MPRPLGVIRIIAYSSKEYKSPRQGQDSGQNGINDQVAVCRSVYFKNPFKDAANGKRGDRIIPQMSWDFREGRFVQKYQKRTRNDA